MTYETDLKEENYYISFVEKLILAQNQCHVFHTNVIYTVIYT